MTDREDFVRLLKDRVREASDDLSKAEKLADESLREVARLRSRVDVFKAALAAETGVPGSSEVKANGQSTKASELLLRLREVDGKPSTSQIIMGIARDHAANGFHVSDAKRALENAGVKHASRVVFTVLKRLENRRLLKRSGNQYTILTTETA